MNNREHCQLLRNQGYSIGAISHITGLSGTTVRYYIKNMLPIKATITKRQFQPKKIQMIPEPLPPSDNLAYLIGVISGDGNIAKFSSTRYRILLSCDSRIPLLIDKYINLLSIFNFGTIKQIKQKNENCVQIYVYSDYIPQLLDIKHGNKKYNDYQIPEWIFTKKSYIQNFIRGLIETDGGIYHIYKKGGWYSFCSFTATIKTIMDAFLRGTEILGYKFKINKNFKANMNNTRATHKLANELNIEKQKTYMY